MATTLNQIIMRCLPFILLSLNLLFIGILGAWAAQQQDNKSSVGQRVSQAIYAPSNPSDGVEFCSNSPNNDAIMYFDKNTGKWHQIWSDENGNLIHFTGEYQGNTLVMKGEAKPKQGRKIRYRISATNLPDGSTHEVWQVSRNGQDWATIIDTIYYASPDDGDGQKFLF